MGAKINEKNVFLVMQAIENARLRPNTITTSGAVRISSKRPDEMSFLTPYSFNEALNELEKNFKVVKIEDAPNERNKNYQEHFQIMKFSNFRNLYLKLRSKFPILDTGTVPDREFHCGSLKFNPYSGKFIYNNAKGTIKTGTAAWGVLYYLLCNKNKGATREALRDAVISSWQRNKGKKAGKSGENINIPEIIKEIRGKLQMKQGQKNKNLITGGGDGKTYKITCN